MPVQHHGTTSRTVSEGQSVGAPTALDDEDLKQGCPRCGFDAVAGTVVEQPSGYYTCLRCFGTWTGDADVPSDLAWFESWDGETITLEAGDAE